MNELIEWIDNSLENASQTPLFKRYFDNIQIKEDEGVFYLSSKEKGIDLVMWNDLIVKSIHLFSGKYKDSLQYRDALPFNLNFSFSRDEIKEILGEPKRSGGGYTDVFFGFIPLWDKFFFNNHSLHFQYSKENLTIDLLTIASLKLESYFDEKLQ